MLQGVCAQIKSGDILDLQYQGIKAQFRVVWLGKHGSDMHGEVGIESLSAAARLWEFDLLRSAAAGPR